MCRAAPRSAFGGRKITAVVERNQPCIDIILGCMHEDYATGIHRTSQALFFYEEETSRRMPQVGAVSIRLVSNKRLHCQLFYYAMCV